MAETPADVRRDIELTRERMSSTLAQLEQKMNVVQLVKDHPWPAIGLAVGAGFLLSGSRVDVKAAAATTVATRGASSRVGSVLDELMANLVQTAHSAFEQRVQSWVGEIKQAIGAPTSAGASQGGSQFAQQFGNVGGQSTGAIGSTGSTSNTGYGTGGSSEAGATLSGTHARPTGSADLGSGGLYQQPGRAD